MNRFPYFSSNLLTTLYLPKESIPLTYASSWEPRTDLLTLNPSQLPRSLLSSGGPDLTESFLFMNEQMKRSFARCKALVDIFDFNYWNTWLIRLNAKHDPLETDALHFWWNTIAQRRLLLRVIPLLEAHAFFKFVILPRDHPEWGEVVSLANILSPKLLRNYDKTTKEVYALLRTTYEKIKNEGDVAFSYVVIWRIVQDSLNHASGTDRSRMLGGLPQDVDPVYRCKRLCEATARRLTKPDCEFLRKTPTQSVQDYARKVNKLYSIWTEVLAIAGVDVPWITGTATIGRWVHEILFPSKLRDLRRVGSNGFPTLLLIRGSRRQLLRPVRSLGRRKLRVVMRHFLLSEIAARVSANGPLENIVELLDTPERSHVTWFAKKIHDASSTLLLQGIAQNLLSQMHEITHSPQTTRSG